jgi:hypothetical protein
VLSSLAKLDLPPILSGDLALRRANPTKAPKAEKTRDQIEDEVAAFLKKGGEIKRIDTGESGFTHSNPYKPNKNIVLS